MSSFCANFLSTNNYKPKLQAHKSYAKHFGTRKLLIKCWWNWHLNTILKLWFKPKQHRGAGWTEAEGEPHQDGRHDREGEGAQQSSPEARLPLRLLTGEKSKADVQQSFFHFWRVLGLSRANFHYFKKYICFKFGQKRLENNNYNLLAYVPDTLYCRGGQLFWLRGQH